MKTLTSKEYLQLPRCKVTDPIKVGDLIVRVSVAEGELTQGGVYKVTDAANIRHDYVSVAPVSDGALCEVTDGWSIVNFAHYALREDEPI